MEALPGNGEEEPHDSLPKHISSFSTLSKLQLNRSLTLSQAQLLLRNIDASPYLSSLDLSFNSLNYISQFMHKVKDLTYLQVIKLEGCGLDYSEICKIIQLLKKPTPLSVHLSYNPLSTEEVLDAVDSLEENPGSHRIGGGRYNDCEKMKIKKKSLSWQGFENIYPSLKGRLKTPS